MKSLRILLLALGVTLALPAVSLAQDHEAHDAEHSMEHGDGEHAEGQHANAEHEHEGVSPVGIAAAFVNFFVLLGIVIYLAKKPTKSFLVSRRAQVVEGLEEAKRLKAAAEEKYAEYQKRLANLDNELAQLRAEIVKSGEAELCVVPHRLSL